MLRRIVSAFAAFVLLFQVPIVGIPEAYADEGEAVACPFFTGVELLIPGTDTVLGEAYETPIAKDAAVTVRYHFMVPDDATIKSGDSYTFAIPDQIKIDGPITNFALSSKNAEGVETVFAHLDVDTNGQGTITFTDGVTTMRGVGGEFNIGLWFDKDDIGNTDKVKIPFVINGENQDINVRFDQPETSSSKSGVYDAATGMVTWTIKLNENGTTVEGATLTDVIAPGKASDVNDRSQTYVEGTFKVQAANGAVLFDSSSEAGSENKGEFAYEATTDDPAQTGTLSYTFADTFEEPVTVTYQTRVADPSQYFGTSVSNEATFNHDGVSQNIPGQALVPEPDYITKSGAYNAATEKIDWTVVFNKEGLDLHGVELTDTLTGGLVLDAGSVKLDGSPVLSGDAGTTNTFSYDSATGKFVYRAGDINAAHTLTFSTDLPAGYWQQNHATGEFSNTAVMTSTDNSYLKEGAGSTSGKVGPANSVIQKSSLGYDVETHLITWQIVVNKDQKALPDATIQDTIPAGLEYIPTSFKITPDNAPINSLTEEQSFKAEVPADLSASSMSLTYHFGAITDSYTITYQTEVVDPAVWAGNSNKDYKNTVTLTPGGTLTPSTGEATQNVTNSTAKKSATYDYTTHELSWSILVNESEVPLTNVTVSDTLTGEGLDDFAFVAGTVTVDGTPVSASAAVSPEVGSYRYDEGTKVLVVNLGDLNGTPAEDRSKTVTFKMKLAKEGTAFDEYFSKNGDKTIGNTATVSSTQNPSTTAKGTQIITNKLVDKTGFYSNGRAFIDWAVQVNQNQVSLKDAVLTDVLQEGLELDTSSVKLYRQTLQSDGTLSPSASYNNATAELSVVGGVSEVLGSENVAYDAVSRTFTFTMPEGVGDGQPCLLVFRTTIDVAHAQGTTFSNSISLAGSGYAETGDSAGQGVRFATIDGEAWGETGEVDLLKTDRATGARLSGAVFGLYDAFGNLVRISEPTDSEGSSVFSHVNYNTLYSVKEIKAPADYAVGDVSYSFKLSKTENGIHLYDNDGTALDESRSDLPFANDRKVGMITFVKTDAADHATPLIGAEFTLYDAEGKDVVSNAKGPLVVCSDEQGVVRFEDVPYGDYLVKETANPNNYQGTVSVEASLHVAILSLGNFDNARSTGSIRFVKTDGNAPLAGAVFELSGNGIDPLQVTSDENGIVEFVGIPYQETPYTVREVAAPADWYRTVADFQVIINDESTAATQGDLVLADPVVDVPFGSIELTKTNEDGSALLSGAVFELLDETGTVVQTQETDASGALSFEDIDLNPTGDTVFTVREKRAPLGYDLAVDQTVILSHEKGVRSADVEVRDALKKDPLAPAKTLTQTGDGLTGALAALGAVGIVSGIAAAVAMARRFRKKA